MKLELEDSDVERIATAVAAKLASAPKTEAAPKPAPKKVTKKEEPAVDRNAVLDLAKAVRAKKGADEAKSIIAEFGEAFKDVSDEDLPKLEAKLKAALEEEDI